MSRAARGWLWAANLLGAAAFAWPFLLPAGAAGGAHSGDAPWVLGALLVCLGLTVFAGLGGRALGPKVVALLGVLGAAVVALRLPGFVAGFSAMFLVVLVAGASFGPGFGFLLGAVGTFASGLFVGGLGPWLPFQMVAVGWVGAGAGLIPRRLGPRGRVGLLAAYGALSGFAFGFVMNLWFWPFAAGSSALSWDPSAGAADNLVSYLRFYALTSAGWDTFRAAGNAALVLALGRPLLAALDRVARRLDVRVEAGMARGEDAFDNGDRESAGRPRRPGPVRGAEEGPGSTGQDAGEIPGGATRGKCHREQTASGGPPGVRVKR